MNATRRKQLKLNIALSVVQCCIRSFVWPHRNVSVFSSFFLFSFFFYFNHPSNILFSSLFMVVKKSIACFAAYVV